MWRYLLPGVIVISGFISVVALDDWLREPQTRTTVSPPVVTPLPAPKPTPAPEPPTALVVPQPSPQPVAPPMPPPIAVAPPAPIVLKPIEPQEPQPTIEPPKPSKPARPRPIATAKPLRPPEPRAAPIEPEPPSVAEDVSTARQWVARGNYSEARQMLARIQTRLVLQPVTPDQPDRNDLNAAATMVGIAMHAIDQGDMGRALRMINDICQMEHCAQSAPQQFDPAPQPRPLSVLQPRPVAPPSMQQPAALPSHPSTGTTQQVWSGLPR